MQSGAVRMAAVHMVPYLEALALLLLRVQGVHGQGQALEQRVHAADGGHGVGEHQRAACGSHKGEDGDEGVSERQTGSSCVGHCALEIRGRREQMWAVRRVGESVL